MRRILWSTPFFLCKSTTSGLNCVAEMPIKHRGCVSAYGAEAWGRSVLLYGAHLFVPAFEFGVVMQNRWIPKHGDSACARRVLQGANDGYFFCGYR